MINCLREGFNWYKKQRLFANAVSFIPNEVVFIKKNMKKENSKNKQVDTGIKNDACRDDKLKYF